MGVWFSSRLAKYPKPKLKVETRKIIKTKNISFLCSEANTLRTSNLFDISKNYNI